MLSYIFLWEQTKRKNALQYRILKHDIDNRTLTRLNKNQNMSAATLKKLCAVPDCEANDVISLKR